MNDLMGYLRNPGGKLKGPLNANSFDITNSYEAATAFMRRNPPIYAPTQAGWAETLVGTGGVTQAIGRLTVTMGATDSSSALASTVMIGLERATAGIWTINWDLKTLLLFYFVAQTADTNGKRWVQLKSVNTLGILAGKGIGVEVSNLTLTGETYGTSRNTHGSSLLTTMNVYEVAILHEPAVPRVTTYLNGTSIGTETTAAKMPTGSSDVYMTLGGQTGAPAVNHAAHIGHIFIFQEKGG